MWVVHTWRCAGVEHLGYSLPLQHERTKLYNEINRSSEISEIKTNKFVFFFSSRSLITGFFPRPLIGHCVDANRCRSLIEYITFDETLSHRRRLNHTTHRLNAHGVLYTCLLRPLEMIESTIMPIAPRPSSLRFTWFVLYVFRFNNNNKKKKSFSFVPYGVCVPVFCMWRLKQHKKKYGNVRLARTVLPAPGKYKHFKAAAAALRFSHFQRIKEQKKKKKAATNNVSKRENWKIRESRNTEKNTERKNQFLHQNGSEQRTRANIVGARVVRRRPTTTTTTTTSQTLRATIGGVSSFLLKLARNARVIARR